MSLLTVPDATSITSTAMTTAAIMTGNSLDMPTAVMTESSENTMSRIMIWMITAANEPAALTVLACSSPSSRPMDLPGRLGDEEQAAAEQDQVAAGDVTASRA